MSNQPTELIFLEHPIVRFATHTFINVPVLLQYEDTPLVEVVQQMSKDYTTQISIFHPDGTQLAVAKGARLHLTDAGRKAQLRLRHPDRKTVCELDGKTLFEIDRTEAAAVALTAELFTPDGRFVRLNDTPNVGLFKVTSQGIDLANGSRIAGGIFRGCKIGIRLRSHGGLEIGVFNDGRRMRIPGDLPQSDQ